MQNNNMLDYYNQQQAEAQASLDDAIAEGRRLSRRLEEAMGNLDAEDGIDQAKELAWTLANHSSTMQAAQRILRERNIGLEQARKRYAADEAAKANRKPLDIHEALDRTSEIELVPLGRVDKDDRHTACYEARYNGTLVGIVRRFYPHLSRRQQGWKMECPGLEHPAGSPAADGNRPVFRYGTTKGRVKAEALIAASEMGLLD